MGHTWFALLSMSLALGMRHGFDLDHLATIDCITRTASNNKKISNRAGLLFSFGHGLVVTILSLMIGSGMVKTHIPEWLDHFGNWISIMFLLMFGVLTLWNVLKNPHTSVIPTGLKNYLSKHLIHKNINSITIVFIGSLFAFSFDTFTQVALFSLSASMVAGFLFSGLLGITFMLGMMISDGMNGLFVSLLIQRANRTSMMISRLFGLIIATFSLGLGLMSFSKMIL